MIKILVLITTVTLISVECNECIPKKTIFNYFIKKTIDPIIDLLARNNMTYINMAKVAFNIGSGIDAKGVKMFDVTKLINQDSYYWTEDENKLRVDLNLGLENMIIEIDNLKYKDKDYPNAKVDVTSGFFQMQQITLLYPDKYVQKFEDFQMKPIEKAVLNHQEDITTDFNNIIIPWINKKLNSDEFHKYVLKYFNRSNSPHSSKNMAQLLLPQF